MQNSKHPGAVVKTVSQKEYVSWIEALRYYEGLTEKGALRDADGNQSSRAQFRSQRFPAKSSLTSRQKLLRCESSWKISLGSAIRCNCVEPSCSTRLIEEQQRVEHVGNSDLVRDTKSDPPWSGSTEW